MMDSHFLPMETGPMSDARKHTLSPSCSGTSVVGIRYKDGVIIAADCLVSYGSLARYTNFERVVKINENTVMGCSGDVADFQFLTREIKEMILQENLLDDGFCTTPEALHNWITRVLYYRRCKFDPLWNTYIVGGVQKDGTPYLGYVNMLGVAFNEDSISSGFGAHIANPILRKVIETKANGDAANLSYEDAMEAIKEALTVLYYRDCRAFNVYNVAVVTKDGATVSENRKLKTNWKVAEAVSGYE